MMRPGSNGSENLMQRRQVEHLSVAVDRQIERRHAPRPFAGDCGKPPIQRDGHIDGCDGDVDAVGDFNVRSIEVGQDQFAARLVRQQQRVDIGLETDESRVLDRRESFTHRELAENFFALSVDYRQRAARGIDHDQAVPTRTHQAIDGTARLRRGAKGVSTAVAGTVSSTSASSEARHQTVAMRATQPHARQRPIGNLNEG